jgi:hypothetical protein
MSNSIREILGYKSSDEAQKMFYGGGESKIVIHQDDPKNTQILKKHIGGKPCKCKKRAIFKSILMGSILIGIGVINY